jgi:hypothetical protein
MAKRKATKNSIPLVGNRWVPLRDDRDGGLGHWRKKASALIGKTLPNPKGPNLNENTDGDSPESIYDWHFIYSVRTNGRIYFSRAHSRGDAITALKRKLRKRLLPKSADYYVPPTYSGLNSGISSMKELPQGLLEELAGFNSQYRNIKFKEERQARVYKISDG